MSGDDRLYLFDTTLRDGQQTRGVDFTVADKVAIARALDEIGIDYVEGGWPGANPTDDSFFADPPSLARARLVAFGMTRRAGRSVQNDPGLAGVLAARAHAACLVGKSWSFHVDVALGIGRDENLAMIADSIAHAAASSFEPMFDCEHFFDGYREDPGFARACAQAAFDAGARWVVLCDTNGGTLPHEVGRIVGEMTAVVPGSHLGIHCHNDTENAVANTLAAVRAGARQVQGTVQRARRALRKRQPVLADPVTGAEDGMPDRRDGGRAAQADRPVAAAGRTAQPAARCPRRLRGVIGLCPQGRPACLGG